MFVAPCQEMPLPQGAKPLPVLPEGAVRVLRGAAQPGQGFEAASASAAAGCGGALYCNPPGSK